MHKSLFTVLILLSAYVQLRAQTTITDGNIDGDTWLKENSPYLITVDLLVHNLVIEPGVEVIFNDNWKMTIDGSLIANGSYSDSIKFGPAQTNTKKWKGIIFTNSSYASVLRYCHIEGTNNYALSVDNCQPEFSNCRLTNNSVGGFYIKNTNLTINHFFLKANTNEGIRLEKSTVIIFNSIFNENGTALYLSNKDDILTAVNCVLVNGSTGIRVPDNGTMTIKNSIIYDNVTAFDVKPEDVLVTYCCTQDGFPGLGNFTADPMFADQASFRLQNLSPCIDAGSPAVADEDRYFPPSLGSRRNDMGAYGGPLAYGWFPPLYFIPQTVGFGRVTQDSSMSLQISIKNYRGTGITISDILPDSSGSGIFAADPANLYLPFEDSTKINVFFRPDSEKTYTSNLAFETSTEGNVSLPVTGRGVLPHLSIPFDSIGFGQISVKDSSKILVPFTNLGGDTLRISFDLHQSSAFSVNPPGLIIGPDSSTAQVEIMFAPQSGGDFVDSLIVNSNDRSRMRASIPLSGTGLSPIIHTSRDSLEFGAVELLSSASLYVRIFNQGNTELVIDSISVSQPDSVPDNSFSIDSTLYFPVILEADTYLTLPVLFHPLSRGQMSGRITILSSDPIQDSTWIYLHGSVLAPRISSDVEELAYGPVDIGSDSTQYLHLKNTGNADLSITGIYFADTDTDKNKKDAETLFYLDTLLSYPVVLKSDKSLALAVRFSPDRRGSFNVQLVINSSDPEAPFFDVFLTGTGIDPEFKISASDLDFGNVPIGRDSLLYLRLNNYGESNFYLSELNFTRNNGDTSHIDPGEFFQIDSSLSFPITLSPQSPVQIPIRFSPLWRGKISARLRLLFSEPVIDSLFATLSGTGTAPELIQNISDLDFGIVEIGKTSDRSFTILNAGNADLWISAWQFIPAVNETTGFYPADATFNPPYLLPPDSSRSISIRYAPAGENEDKGLLVIQSNDPFNRQDSIRLHGYGYNPYFPPHLSLSINEIDFGTVTVGEESTQVVTLYNKGSGQLIILHDSLSISGPAQEDYSLAGNDGDIFISDGDSAHLYIRFQPLSIGKKEANLQFATNDPQVPDTLILLSGSAKMVNPAVVSLDTTHTSNPFIYNQAGVLAVRIDSVSSIDSAQVYLRRAGKSGFTPYALDFQESGSFWETQISAASVYACGMEYYIRVYYGPHVTTFPDQGPLYPEIISVFIPQIDFPQKTRKETYQMISVPFISENQTLEDLFADDLGNYDKRNYRIFGCDDGISYNELDKLDTSLPPGQALWMISKESFNLGVENVYSVPSDQSYALSLKKGWNMIASPFAFPVDWQSISSELGLRYYDGTDWTFASLLEPFKGFAVKAEEETTLLIPASETGLEKKNSSFLPMPLKDGWTIQIQGSAGNSQDRFNFAGANPASVYGIDRFDYPDPPPIGNYIQISLRIPDRKSSYSSDIRAVDEEGYRFEIVLNSTIDQEKQIRFTPFNLPERFDWTVISDETGVNYGKNEVLTQKKSGSYSLIVGSEDYLEQAVKDFLVLPKAFHVSQNYPNPFNPLTRIKFQIPLDQNITVIIYDLLGRKIKYLADDRYMEAGYHELIWDGTDKSNRSVSSGIYFLQFKSIDFSKTIKMVLQH